MMEVNSLKIKFAKALMFLSLLLSAGLFVKQIWAAYQSKATSIIFSTENVEYFDNPAIMFCFNPASKLSVLKSFNLSESDFVFSENPNGSLTFNESWVDIYRKASYKYGADFTFEILTHENEQVIDSDDKNEVEIEEVFTFWSGLCTKLRLKEKIGYDTYNTIILKFGNSIEMSDIPIVKMYFSSEENSCKHKTHS